MKAVLKALKELKGKKALILTHHNADFDAISSSIALYECLRKIGSDASIGVAESISKPARRIAEGYEIIINPDCSEFDKIVLVETSVPEQLSGVKNLRADIVIDHHPKGKLTEGAVCLIDESSKSAAQLTFKILKELEFPVGKKLAKIIATGIVADTAHLRLADVETLEVLLELLKKGVGFSDVLSDMEMPQEFSEKVAVLKSAKRVEVYAFEDLIVAFSAVSSHEAAAARALMKIGSDIAVVFAKRDSELRISSRGRKSILERGIDLSDIFKEVGKFIEGNGGGHDLAGSANGKPKDLSQVRNLILKLVSEKTKKSYKKLE